MKTILELAFDKHKDWINVVRSFGCNPNQAEDVVQEMYLQLHKDLNKGLDFTYKSEINHYYCYKVLRGIFWNIYKKETKQTKLYMDDVYYKEDDPQKKIESILKYSSKINKLDDSPIDEKQCQERYDKVKKEISNLYWYDAKVFEIVASGKSVASLSRETKISYYSLYNTYRNALKYIKEKI